MKNKIFLISILAAGLAACGNNEPIPETPLPDDVADLGLSVCWSKNNLAAATPSECGAYFAWGETDIKPYYDWSSYKWCRSAPTSLTKYNSSPTYGKVDNKLTLDKSDDAALQKLGDKYRIPTEAQFKELMDHCYWTPETIQTPVGTVKGYRITSHNEEYTDSIFLPFNGYYSDAKLNDKNEYGYYWTSERNPYIPTVSIYLRTDDELVTSDGHTREAGMGIRPVYVK